jgi:hypothetical protein
MASDSGKNSILKTDLNFNLVKTIQLPSGPSLQPGLFAASGDTIAIAGYDHYGVSHTSNGMFNQVQCWFHTSWGAAVSNEPATNAAVLAVEQTKPFSVSGNDGTPGERLTLSGGRFKIQVQNKGNQILNQVYLNTLFNYLEGICSNAPAYHRLFSNLSLKPGDTQWLMVDDLSVEQEFITQKICFWTSSPNGLPDNDRSDDEACTDLQLSTHSPLLTPLFIYPNPSDAAFYIKFPYGYDNSGPYNIYDSIGRLVMTGVFAGNLDLQRLSTAAWAQGVYWFRQGPFYAKVAVQHGF